MNTWFRRTVGTVGLAGGILLLGAGAAHADDALVPGQLDDLFSPVGGPDNQSLQLDSRGSRIDTDAAGTAAAGRAATTDTTARGAGQQLPLAGGLPLSTVLPTDSLGLPRTTSSRIPSLPTGLPGGLPTGLPGGLDEPGGLDTEGSTAALPLVGSLQQLGLPAMGGMPVTAGDTMRGTSIADHRAAFPGLPDTEATALPIGNGAAGLPLGTEAGGLPLVGGLTNGLPVQGTLKPINDFAAPVGAPGQRAGSQRVQRIQGPQHTEAGPSALPLVGDLPLGGSDVLKNDSVTGVPVLGGVGPTPGVSTIAVADRFVPTTGAVPQATSRLPLTAEKIYAPKHSTMYSPKHSSNEEALPVGGGLPLVGGLAGGGLPLVG